MAEQIVIAGPHRSGKTTLALLLRKFLEETKGQKVFIRGPMKILEINEETRTPNDDEGFDVIIHDGVMPENPNTNYRLISASKL